MSSPPTDPDEFPESAESVPDPVAGDGDRSADPAPPTRDADGAHRERDADGAHRERDADDAFSERAPAGALPESDAFAELETEVLKWRDVALRAKADLENFRKRIAREKSDAIRFANADLLRSLLPILDNFEWGLEAARQESESSSIYQGMQMVRRQIDDFLANEGAVPIDAVGSPFDPNQHEAVAQEASDSVPEGTVIAQTRRGFRLGDRLLRPAAVVVSAGPAAPEGATPGPGSDPSA